MSQPPNAQQAAYWNEQAGPTWVDMVDPLDRQLAPLGRAAMRALALRPSEAVLDVGCGAGATTLELAQQVGAAGRATGVDISRPLLETARRRAERLANVEFLEADGQSHPFPPASYDALFSRFGVMFFAEPTVAFANLRRALKAGGRMAFVCWQASSANPIMTLPMQAALAHVPAPPPPADPTAPGPFAFADADRLRGILDAAGFRDVVITPHLEKIGSGDLETALAVSLKVGPLGALLRENPDQRDAVIAAVRAALSAHDGPDGVRLDSATWIVTANNPG